MDTYSRSSPSSLRRQVTQFAVVGSDPALATPTCGGCCCCCCLATQLVALTLPAVDINGQARRRVDQTGRRKWLTAAAVLTLPAMLLVSYLASVVVWFLERAGGDHLVQRLQGLPTSDIPLGLAAPAFPITLLAGLCMAYCVLYRAARGHWARGLAVGFGYCGLMWGESVVGSLLFFMFPTELEPGSTGHSGQWAYLSFVAIAAIATILAAIAIYRYHRRRVPTAPPLPAGPAGLQ